MRGVYTGCSSKIRCTDGPSPRAWGLRYKSLRHISHNWSIPTCVGFTPISRSNPFCLAVHPHVRGVYACIVDPDVICDGPSPRAWGLRSASKLSSFASRSIPTCVGFTHPRIRQLLRRLGPSPRAWGLRLRQPRPGPRSPVHPHVRGVYSVLTTSIFPLSGPSPRAWGLRRVQHRLDDDRRSIPTCVGFTSSIDLAKRSLSVHPHVRGVYL